MPSLMQPKKGAGRFQWNAGGWFGPVIGSTAWMIGPAGCLIAHRRWLAAVPIGCFVIMNLLGWILWRFRDRLAPFPALITMLASLAMAVPIILATTALGTPNSPPQMNLPSSPLGWLVVVLFVPAMIVWFYVIEHRSKRSVARSGDTTVDTT